MPTCMVYTQPAQLRQAIKIGHNAQTAPHSFDTSFNHELQPHSLMYTLYLYTVYLRIGCTSHCVLESHD